MKYDKIIVLAIFLVSLLAISAVSAADNVTDDAISVGSEDIDDVGLSEISDEDQQADDSLQSSFSDDSENVTSAGDDYSNVYVKNLNAYYGGDNVIQYGWTGSLNGYFEIYKGDSLLYQTRLSSYGGVHDESYKGSAIKAVGTYNAVITDEYDVVLAKATIKINKVPTRVVSPSFSSYIGAKDYVAAGIADKSKNKLFETSGTAKFKIAGKTYTTKFKKGIAYIFIKFPLKAKKYTCSVKFLGNKNYKASYCKFNIKLSKSKVVILKKNKKVKVGKYTVKLTLKQYKAIVKAFKKNKSKTLDFKTKYKYKVKVPYSKAVKKYKTTKAVKTWYAASYMPMINKMHANGWTKVSEYTYNQANPKNKYGIGLSSYTIAVCKWVKVSYKTAYKTKYYPIKAYISFKKSTIIPSIELYSHGKTLTWKYMAIS